MLEKIHKLINLFYRVVHLF